MLFYTNWLLPVFYLFQIFMSDLVDNKNKNVTRCCALGFKFVKMISKSTELPLLDEICV